MKHIIYNTSLDELNNKEISLPGVIVYPTTNTVVYVPCYSEESGLIIVDDDKISVETISSYLEQINDTTLGATTTYTDISELLTLINE